MPSFCRCCSCSWKLRPLTYNISPKWAHFVCSSDERGTHKKTDKLNARTTHFKLAVRQWKIPERFYVYSNSVHKCFGDAMFANALYCLTTKREETSSVAPKIEHKSFANWLWLVVTISQFYYQNCRCFRIYTNKLNGYKANGTDDEQKN